MAAKQKRSSHARAAQPPQLARTPTGAGEPGDETAVAIGHLAAIVKGSADAIFTKDLEGTIQAWNPAAERLYGYARDEAVGRSVEMLFPKDRAQEFATIMERVRHGGTIEHLETERVRKDGQRVAVDLTVSPVRDSHGQVVSASVIARDITERKRAEHALKEREARLRAILDTAADAIITIDDHGIIQSVNTAAERMFGYAAAEMLGQNVKMLMPPPDREEHDGYIARYLQTGEKHIIGIGREVEAQRKDGSVFPTELAISEIEHLKLFTGIHRDLTQRRQLERDAADMASREQQRIGRDLHDTVGQELTGLSLLAGELANALRTDPARVTRLLERIVEALQRCQQQLRSVMRGLVPVAVESAGLMAALTDLADDAQQVGEATCVFDCPAPVAVTDHMIATHLYLIAREAVHNALKHGQPRNIRISLRSSHVRVLKVQCDGIGMPARLEAKAGLGLRIMRNRAAIIGATLTIEPAAPTGTVVTCVLAKKTHEHESEPTESASPGPARR
jgi:PAS domain S-box-containing protein